MKRFIFLSLLAISLAACNKGVQSRGGCGVKACTLNAVYLYLFFVDSDNKPATLSSFSAVNQRAGLNLELKNTNPPLYGGAQGSVVIATDAMLSQFSDEGDDILITATSQKTGQTKTAIINIAGGCNCHIEKKSGPEKIQFD
jgi:hypothetical protein